MTTLLRVRAQPLFRVSARDAVLVAASGLHAAALLAFPTALTVGVLFWWNANTVSHNFIHNRCFHSRRLNRLYAAWLTLLLGVPQTLWAERHLAHHAGTRHRLRLSRPLIVETVLTLALWATILWAWPAVFLGAYLPGLALGLVLSALQGRYEHRGGAPVDHHGRLYNTLFFNDGYHTLHHARPGLHWSELPTTASGPVRLSRWPAVLRWLDIRWLDVLERGALHAGPIRRWLVRSHERAIGRVLLDAPVRRAAIVGGGLFPRTAIVLRRLFPQAQLTVIDRSARSLARAESLLPDGVETLRAEYAPDVHGDFDLVVIPLAYVGDREALYARPPAARVLVHDWMWRRRGKGARVSAWLLKRVNLVTGEPA